MQTTTQLRFTTKILLNILGPCPLARASLRRSKVRKRSKASFSYQWALAHWQRPMGIQPETVNLTFDLR